MPFKNQTLFLSLSLSLFLFSVLFISFLPSFLPTIDSNDSSIEREEVRRVQYTKSIECHLVIISCF
jgi:hypothetical protein